MLFLIGEVN